MIRIVLSVLFVATVSSFAAAQDAEETLADVRQELSVLYVEVQRLKRELSTTGTPESVMSELAPLERIDAIERELRRLTAKTEEIEFKIDRIATRGGRQIGDLEFRLCELEAGCDIAALTDGGTTLGEVEVNAFTSVELPESEEVQLAVGERADFDRASAALDDGDMQSAAEQFDAFVRNYPGGPMVARAYFLRGRALEDLGQIRDAARAYLDSFSTAPNGPVAPEALFKVGIMLSALGQEPDACQMLNQVGVRFPGSEAEGEARAAMVEIGCT